MLSNEQKRKLDKMVANYTAGVIKTSIAPYHIQQAWVLQYRIAMERVLLNQCKH